MTHHMRDEITQTVKKIKSMEIRGAANIGRYAAAALKAYTINCDARSRDEFVRGLEEAGETLIDARPTAVSLPNAVKFVLRRVRDSDLSLEGLKELAVRSADAFIENSRQAVRTIGEIGAKRISDGDTIMTHCNSSVALSVIKTAFSQGKDIRVIASEARPRYQGRITVKQLAEAGVPVTLIVDSAVRSFMKDVDKVVVGADSIAANGAVINKIGTSQIALAAHEARVLFFVAAETYKFHPDTLVGELVEIEERDKKEVADPGEFSGVDIRNPAFDITPPDYVDLIITEKGVIPPQAAIMIIKEEFGWI